MIQFKKEFLPEYTASQLDNSRYLLSGKFFLHLLWLFLSVSAIYLFGIEKNKGLDKVAIGLSVGFILYTLVPLNLKQLSLVILAFGIEIILLGVKPAIGVLAVMIVFTVITYVPSKVFRTIMVLLLTAVSILITLHFIKLPVVRIVIMYASVFLMMRYIFLAYELKHFKTKPVFIDRLCYLFLLPNACFPLFAVIDPKVFMSKFYDIPAIESFKKGLTWITRGILHTLIYRCIYLYLTPSPYEIDGFWSFLQFIFSGYSLILRLSGLFYISLGFLCLFGFNLPAIFDHYFFASGFSDLWRRINLYWRSFMERVFFYPILFKLKKYPMKLSILITTLLMFAATWFLHAWQWFWIKGKFTILANDVLFWTFLGIVISINSALFLNAVGNKQNASQNSFTYLKKGASVIFMLIAMSFLWTFWTASSLTEWWYLMSFIKIASLNDWMLVGGSLIALLGIAALIRYLYETKNYFTFVFKDFSLTSGILVAGLFSSSFLVLQQTALKNETIAFAANTLNTRDKAAMERGYYEQMLNNDEKSIELFNISNLNKKWNLDNKAYVQVNSLLVKEFKSDFSTVFKGDSLSTNTFGLRDKNYELVKKEGSIRISAIGGSYEMGSGVSNEENFLALLEQNLNNSNYTDQKIEILNYGAGGYHLLQNVYVTENKVKKLNPDYLFYFAHTEEANHCLENFVNVIEKKMPLSFPFLDSICVQSGITQYMCRLEKHNRIKPFMNSIIAWGYSSISSYCKENGIIPVLVYLPTNANLRDETDKVFCFEQATKAGFNIVDLSGVYDGHLPESIQLSLWDAHPNKNGHQLIANKLLEELVQKKSQFNFLK